MRLKVDVTIIMNDFSFHNEAWSTLIRTLHSIINRTPDHLVEEILLIDDNSDMPHLKEQLDEYLEKIPKARIIHSEERLGVIRCRMKGSEEAKGQVLTYLDSHIEAGIGWLEPLIHRVHDDPKVRTDTCSRASDQSRFSRSLPLLSLTPSTTPLCGILLLKGISRAC